MADLITVWTFFENADAHAAFLHRVAVAAVETALDIRQAVDPDPVTPVWIAKETWALKALAEPMVAARGLLPALAVMANEAGFIGDDGFITATDEQIRGAVAGLVDAVAYWLPG